MNTLIKQPVFLIFTIIVTVMLIGAAMMTRDPYFWDLGRKSEAFPFQVSGAVERDLVSNQFFVAQPQGKYYAADLMYVVDDNNYYTVSVHLPLDVQTGVYKLSNGGASYVEMDRGVLRRFDRNVSGSMQVIRSMGRIECQVSFQAQPDKSKRQVTVTSEFTFVAGRDVQPLASTALGMIQPLLIAGVIFLFLVNFYLLAKVGSHIYQGEDVGLLVRMNARYIFPLGWRYPELRGTMNTWVWVLVGIAFLWIMFMGSMMLSSNLSALGQ